ncbi:MAG TPA: hypothetical protein VKG85_06030 [Actinomycetes bacterium]|nr:hypothetical protein [Actinomycetes bacterium]
MAERKKFLLRLDPDVFAAIQRWADDELRSVNAQVEFALRQALRAAGRPVRNPGRTATAPSVHPESTDQEPPV